MHRKGNERDHKEIEVIKQIGKLITEKKIQIGEKGKGNVR